MCLACGIVLVAGLGVLLGGLRDEAGMEELGYDEPDAIAELVMQRGSAGTSGRTSGGEHYVELGENPLTLGVHEDTVADRPPQGAGGDGWGAAPSEGESMTATAKRHEGKLGNSTPKSPSKFARVLVE